MQPFFAICVPRCCPLGNDNFGALKNYRLSTQGASKAVRLSKWPMFAKLRAAFIHFFRNPPETTQFPCFLLSRPDTTDMCFLLRTHISWNKKHSPNELFPFKQSPLILKTRHQVCETARSRRPELIDSSIISSTIFYLKLTDYCVTPSTSCYSVYSYQGRQTFRIVKIMSTKTV